MPAKKKVVEKLVKELSPIDKLIQEYADQKKKAQERLDKLRAVQDDVKNFEKNLKLIDRDIEYAKKQGRITSSWRYDGYGELRISYLGINELELIREDCIRQFEQASSFLATLVKTMEETPDDPQI